MQHTSDSDSSGDPPAASSVQPEAAKASEPAKGRARQAAGSALMVITARALATGVSLISVYFYTRYIKPEDLALSLIAGMLGELCFIFGDCGLGLCMERRLPGVILANREDGLSMIAVSMYILVITSTILCAIIFMLAGSLARLLLKDSAYAGLLVVSIPFIVAVVWRNFLFCLMRGVNAYGRLSVLSLSSQILYATLTISGYWWLGMRGFLIGAFLGYALPSLYESWVLRRYLGAPPGLSRFRQYMSLSSPYFAERYLNYGFTYADQWFIGLLIDPTALAAYYVPRNFYDRIQGLLDGFWMVPTTVLSRESARGMEVARLAMETLRRFFAYVFIPMGVGLLASSYFLVDLLAGPKYPQAFVPFAILAISFTITGAFAASPVGLIVLAPPKERLKMVVIQNGFYLAGLPLLIWGLGLNGVALARTLGSAVGVVAAWWLLRKLVRVSEGRNALMTVLLPSLVMFTIVAGGQYLHYNRLLTPLYMTLGGIAYIIIFFFLVPVADLRMLEHLLPDRLRFLMRIGLRMRGEQNLPASA
jgi:O-antigen/teichoic acid export membrane protein